LTFQILMILIPQDPTKAVGGRGTIICPYRSCGAGMGNHVEIATDSSVGLNSISAKVGGGDLDLFGSHHGIRRIIQRKRLWFLSSSHFPSSSNSISNSESTNANNKGRKSDCSLKQSHLKNLKSDFGVGRQFVPNISMEDFHSL